MGTDLVSVIMPVYNGEKFLKKSIGSIFAQTYCQIEFIAVNDGSTDCSWELLKKARTYAPKNVYMRILSQENQGISNSRNNALNIAKGKYIMFIDQDDYMKKDCIEHLCKEMETKNADLVIGGFFLIDENNRVLESWRLNPKSSWSKFRILTPWGRLFKKEIIDLFQLRFMVTKISEDVYFNLLYMSYCRSIFISPYQGYFWLCNKKSESYVNMKRLDKERNLLKVLKKLHLDMNFPNILESECLEYAMIKHVIWYLFYVAKSADEKSLHKAYVEYFSWLLKYYPTYEKNKLLHIGKPKGEDIKKRIVVKLSIILLKLHLFYPILLLYSKI